MERRPIDVLEAVSRREASGELICASATAEVHVFLQRGRIAWATDSEHPFAFTRYLQKTAQIDAEAFRDILESCKREKRPLGETLVSWGVATPEEVRDALRHQVVLALEVLCTGGPAQTLFLDRTRQFSQYESSLTFELNEILPGACTGPDVGVVASPTPSIEPGPGSAVPEQYARRLLDSVEGVLWAELLEATRVLDAAPEPARSDRFPREIVERSVLDGAQLVALRSPEGTLAGVALPDTRSLWCRLAVDATVGAAVSALAAFGQTDRNADGGAELGSGATTAWTGGASEGQAADELRGFLARAPEALCALVTSHGDDAWWSGAGAGGIAPEWALDLVHRRARVLGVGSVFEELAPRADDEEGVGFRFRSMMSAERRVWCFGADLETRPRRTLWLLLDRRASQGLGWAYLTSLSRQLLHVRSWGGRNG
jgi:hypothetical protein